MLYSAFVFMMRLESLAGSLTAKEKEVLANLVKGKFNKEIAVALGSR
ncbi:MAG: LuxR C-terminal-related transcriptional regulator [Bacillota bacterium]